MHEPLDNVHIQALENDFILPIVIRQMMQGLEPLDQIAALTMHDILEELEPDTALLCIALSARKIALHCAHMPAAGMLEKETNRQIAYYGPLWLIHTQQNDMLDDQEVFSLLSRIPDDLQALGQFIGNMRAQISIKDRVPCILCEILGGQAETFKGRALSMLRSTIIQQNINDVMAGVPDTEKDIIAFPVMKKMQHELS